MILDLTGAPVAPSQIVQRLKQIDDHLDLKYVRYPKDGGFDERWAVVEKWNDNDKRRAKIQSGEINPASDFDVIGYLPVDATPESAFGYIEMALSRMRDHPTIHVDRLLQRLDKWNERAFKDNMKPVTELADELIETNKGTLFREQGHTSPKVFVTDHRPKPKSR